MARPTARRRCRSLLLGAVVALTAGSVAPSLARAADPAGAIVIAGGDSARAADMSLGAFVDGRLIVQHDTGQLAAITPGGGSTQALASNAYFRSALGDMVLYDDQGYREGSPIHWVNTSTHAMGVADGWKAASAHGGYSLGFDSASGETHLYDHDVAKPTAIDLGPIAAGDLTGADVLSNADGAAVIDNGHQVGYFVNATSHAVTTLSIRRSPAGGSNLYCRSISSNAIGCKGLDGAVLRIPLNGDPAVVVAHIAGGIGATYVTDEQTAWIGPRSLTGSQFPRTMYTQPAAGGTTAQRTIDGDLTSTPAAFYFQLGTTLPDAAIYSAPSADATPTKVVGLPHAPLTANGIALTPGRVSWRDDSTTAQPLWTRSLSSSGGAITAGPRSLVADGVTDRAFATSGLRTAYAAGAHDVVVTDGTSTTQIHDVLSPGGVTVSGSRVSYADARTRRYRVLNLRTQQSTDTTATLGASLNSGVALWGNYYAFSKSDGSLWRKDLSSSAAAVQVAAKSPSPEYPYTNRVYEWGDWVAYTHEISTDLGSQFVSAYRNMRTLEPETGVGDVQDQIVGASAGGVELRRSSLPAPEPYELIAWEGQRSVALPTSVERDATFHLASKYPPAVDGSTVAWIGNDNLPRVAPLGVTVMNRPRALGAAVASSTLPAGGSWRVELPTSAALTSCEVSLAGPTGAKIRTLSCADDAAAQGEAVAAWNGKDADGDAVAPGTYFWTVTAAGADGPLLAADGSTSAVSGTVNVLAPSLFHPVAPSRLLDTRSKLGGTRPAGRGTVKLQVAGRGGVPATGVAAVALNVTVVHPTSSGFVTAYADGLARPNASNLNFVAGQAVPNLVTVPVGEDGRVDLYNGSVGATDLVADVAGYYATTASSTPGAFVSTSPTRLLDTRSTLGAPAVAASRGTVALDVAGHGPVPASGVSAVLLNVTASGSTASGFLTVYGGGSTRPTASNLNFPVGRTVPNLVVAPVGSDGRVNIYNGSTGTTHIIADVAGYYLAGTPTQSGAFVTTGPKRLLDTRSSYGGSPAHSTVVLPVAGRDPVPAAGAAVLNVTAAGATAAGYVTVFPHGTTRPTASNLNFVAGTTVANLVDARLGDGGQVDLYNGSTGSTDLIVDLSGYFIA